MMASDGKRLPAVGTFRIEEADSPAALAMFGHGATMARSWAARLRTAEEMEKG
jgi:hypothetical protein